MQLAVLAGRHAFDLAKGFVEVRLRAETNVVLSTGPAIRLAAALANQVLFIADGHLAGMFTVI